MKEPRLPLSRRLETKERTSCSKAHSLIEDQGEGCCPMCGKSYCEIIFDNNSTSVVCGGFYLPDDTPPSWDNVVKIIEDKR